MFAAQPLVGDMAGSASLQTKTEETSVGGHLEIIRDKASSGLFHSAISHPCCVILLCYYNLLVSN